jgi:SAM-dependent methyltransferase
VDAASERERLRLTFDTVAADYQQARPEYPDALYDTLIELTGIDPETDSLCEVGCASGKATLPLARRGFAITGVELGAALAAEARRNLAGFDRVTVVRADFETWAPGSETRDRSVSGFSGFGLVFAATAWHWIDPAVKYARAAALLRPGGHVAFWEALHVTPAGGDPFFAELQDVYDEIGEGTPPGHVLATPETLASHEAEIAASGLFGGIVIRRFDWEIRYPAESYIRLLGTFSSHIAMRPWQRDRLYGEIRRRLALRPDGMVRRHWGGVLHVARKLLGRWRSSVAGMASAKQKRRRAVLAVVLIGYAVGTIVAVRQGYRFGRNVVVRCRQGHVFSTVFIPGGSLKAIRLGLWRVQWCPVGRHIDLVRLVKDADLTEAEREFAAAHHDVPVP